MQKFEHSATVVATAISIMDAVTMVSLMDRLAKEFVNLSNRVREESSNEVISEYVKLGHQLHILEECGFCTSVPGMIQYDREFFPA